MIPALHSLSYQSRTTILPEHAAVLKIQKAAAVFTVKFERRLLSIQTMQEGSLRASSTGVSLQAAC